MTELWQGKRCHCEGERTFDALRNRIASSTRSAGFCAPTAAMAERLGRTPEPCAGSTCRVCSHGWNAPLGLCPHAQALAAAREYTTEVYEELLGGHSLILALNCRKRLTA
jgi:hypothetical protein